MARLFKGLLMAGSLGAGLTVAAAAQQPVAVPSVSAAPAIAAYYQRFPARVWFKAGAEAPALDRMVAILEKAPFDGVADGPQLAAHVQAARALARSGKPADIDAADRAVSAAWVAYVQVMKRPTPGMVYMYPVLAPPAARPDQILLTAASASSLDTYLVSASRPNPLYTTLRDAAIAEGRAAPDPRLIANLDRLRSIPASGRFMVVDSGTQMLTMFDNGRPVDAMKIVVGKAEYPTPMIASVMYYIVYNPYWNAPDHLVRKIAQNYLTMGEGYLKTRGYQVMKDWTAASEVLPSSQVDWKAVASGKSQIRIRQKPQDDNSMGDLKFPFPNNLDIFLHDTPHKEYFAKASRNLSNGCVRLEDARRLGRWLLGREPVPPGSDAEIQVQLPRGVPIYLTYTTAEVRDGKIAYRADPYGLDPRGGQSKTAGR